MAGIVLLSDRSKKFLQERAISHFFYDERYDLRQELSDFSRTVERNRTRAAFSTRLASPAGFSMSRKSQRSLSSGKSAGVHHKVMKSIWHREKL